jgi:hypothetical protein
MTAGAAARTHHLVQAASAGLFQEGVLTAPLLLKGSDVWVFYRKDKDEWDRRNRVGAERLDRMDALETLLQLPVGMPVPGASLADSLCRAVDVLPMGAALVEDGQVTRQAVRPLVVDMVVVRSSGRNWRDGLKRAGRFAPFGRRALLVDPPPQERETLLLEAAFYGIGILTLGGDTAELLLEPRAYRPRRHTAAAWRFVEQVYLRLV